MARIAVSAPAPLNHDRLNVLSQLARHVRTDTYARRWVNSSDTRSGYEPAATYEWQVGEGGTRKKHRTGDLFPLTASELAGHLRGNATVGVYFVLPDGGVMAGGIDVDAHLNKTTGEPSRTWAEVWAICTGISAQLAAKNVRVAWFRSRSGLGANGWVFWDQRQLPATVRGALTEAVIATIGHKPTAGDVEVFPKQDAIGDGEFGNLMCLPFAGCGALLDAHGVDMAVPAGWTLPVSDDLTTVAGGKTSALAGGAPAASLAGVRIDMNAAAQAGLSEQNSWFPVLDAATKNEVVRTCLDAIDNTKDDPYDRWRDIGFACQAARASGADQAAALFREWSRRGASYTNDAAVDALLDSDRGGAGRRIGVGTLLAKGLEAGADLSRFRDTAPTAVTPADIDPHPGIISALPTEMTPDVGLRLANQLFFFAHDWGGEPLIGHERPDGVRALSEQQLRTMLASRYVLMPKLDAAGKQVGVERVPLGRWWLAHPQRREFDRVIYDPEGLCGRPGERVFNLWTGFAKAPLPGSWSRLARHLHGVICKRNRAAWRYLLHWLAHAAQHPGTAPGTVPVFKSDAEGTGKSIVLGWMARIFGEHALMLSTPEDLIGQFNDHLESKSLIGLNEPAFPGDHRAAGKLKSMITEPTWLLNGKFRAARRVPNIAHIVLTTNASWAVPAGNQARRFFVLDVDEGRAGDRTYFNALWAEAESGGVEAMLHALLRIDLNNFSLLDVPKTQALRLQQVQSAPTTTRWAADAVTARELIPPPPGIGSNPGSGGGFNARHHTATLYDAYKRWASDARQRPVSHVEFGRWLNRCGFPRTMVRGAPTYDIPDADVFGAAVLRQAGIV